LNHRGKAPLKNHADTDEGQGQAEERANFNGGGDEEGGIHGVMQDRKT
jgi:hypothetical protein